MSRMEFRTDTHNPYTIYVTSETDAKYGGRGLPGWMRENEWFVGSLPYEGLVAVAVEALNAFVCERCPWGCDECSLNRSDCGCYSHRGDGDTPPPSPTRAPGVGALVAAINVTYLVDNDRRERPALNIATELIDVLGAQGWRLIHD